jgi:hypothetical protein
MPVAPNLAYVCNRCAWRFKPGHDETATVQFHLDDGSHVMLNLLEISEGGLRFILDDGRPEPLIGTHVDATMVQVGDFRIWGQMRVTHITPEFAVGTVCGVAFMPSTKADKKLMKLLLYDLEKRCPRPK